MGDTTETTRLTIRFPAAATELSGVRRRLREWLEPRISDPRLAYDLLLAADEACANAIEHGHRGDSKPIELRVDLTADTIHITITDQGRWLARDDSPDAERGNPDSLRGRGLALIRSLLPGSSLTITDSGTTVELCASLPPEDS